MSKFQVSDIKHLTASTLLLSVKSVSGSNITFTPGQYAAISFKRFGRPTPMRCFSIASSPKDSNDVQFAIKVQGDFTTALTELKLGDIVRINGPYGDFVIDEVFDKKVLLIAGGIGITPFMSIIKHATTSKLKIPITLLYSCQNQDDVPFHKELINLEKENPNFKVTFFITGGEINKLTGNRVFKGRITEETLSQITDNSYDSFTHFICGPIGFISAIQKILIKNNVSPDHLITEAFGQGLVTEKSHKKPIKETRLVFTFTAVLLVMGIVFISAIDLVRAVPKITKIENTTTAPTNNTTSGSSTSGTLQSNTTNNGTTNTTTPTPTQTTTKNPVTSVS